MAKTTTLEDKIERERSLHSRLFEICMRSRTLGLPLTISASSIDPDKRSRARTIRDIVAIGYIKDHGPVSGMEQYYLIDAALVLALVPACPIDLTVYKPEGRVEEGYAGVAVERLTPGQYKYVAMNNELYCWRFGNGWKYQDFTFGDKDSYLAAREVIGLGGRIFVTNQALQDAIEADALSAAVESNYNQNLAWALEELLQVPKADVKTIACDLQDGSFLSTDRPSPDQWVNRLSNRIEDLRAHMKAEQARLFILEGIERCLEGQDGSVEKRDRFLAEYRAKIVEATVKARVEAKAKKDQGK